MRRKAAAFGSVVEKIRSSFVMLLCWQRCEEQSIRERKGTPPSNYPSLFQ